MRTKVILLAYNRPEHTKEVLEGLHQEGVTDIRIFMDYPKTNFDRAEQKKIEKIVNTIKWASIELVKRRTNLGLANSIIDAVTKTLNEYDSVIVLEDDCVPKKGFYKYMIKSLNKYKEDSKVRTVCGYSYFENDNNYFIQRFCPWGWATWKDKWSEFKRNLNEIVDEFLQKKGNISDLPKDI